MLSFSHSEDIFNRLVKFTIIIIQLSFKFKILNVVTSKLKSTLSQWEA